MKDFEGGLTVPSLMRLSVWASQNRKKAIAAIAALCVGLDLIAALIGNALFAEGFVFPEWLGGAFILAMSLIAITFPKKDRFFESRRARRTRWARERAHHGLVYGLSFLMWIYFGDRFFAQILAQPNDGAATALSIVGSAETSPNLAFSFENSSKSSFFEKKLKRPAQKAAAWAVKKYRDEPNRGAKIAAFFIGFALCIVGGFLLIGLSCSLSCSGNEGAAAIVAVLGLLFIIGSLALLVLGIVKAASKPKEIAGNEPEKPKMKRKRSDNLPDSVKN